MFYVPNTLLVTPPDLPIPLCFCSLFSPAAAPTRSNAHDRSHQAAKLSPVVVSYYNAFILTDLLEQNVLVHAYRKCESVF